MPERISRGGLRVALVVAALAAVVVLTGIFGELAAWICLGLIVVATLLTAGERREEGGGWWTILGIGAALSLLGAALAQVSETAGGLVAVIGGAMVVVGATVGFPTGDG